MSYIDHVPTSSRENRARALAPATLAGLALLLAALTVSTPARAEPDDKIAQAKALLQEANAQYAVGEFIQAAEKYQAAYKLKPDAALLYNAAQSYRMAGNNERALLLYKNYVMFYPNAKNVPNVEQQIAKLQEAIAAQEKAKTQPPTTTEPSGGVATSIAAGIPTGAPPAAAESAPGTTPPPLSATGVPAAPAPAAAAAPGVTLTSPSSASNDDPIYKKWWLWTAIGVVALGAVVTVLAVSGSGGTWSTAPDFGPGASHLVSR